MGSSSKKKKEKQKDFAKPKLRVGKSKPKADNHTSTSFKSKAVVVGHQSLNAAAPTAQTQLKHNLTLLNHHSYTTRRDSVAHIASVLSSLPSSGPPLPYSVILPALAPLILDSAAPVRNQLLTLLTNFAKPKDLRQDAIIPADAVRMHTPRFLLYIHSAMTHISADIRADSTNFLAFLLDVVGEEAVRGAKGWGKTLKCWMVLLGWESATAGGGVRTSTIEFSDPGKNKKASLQHLGVLKRFLTVGMLEVEEPVSHLDIGMNDFLRPHQYTELYLLPRTSNIYAHLSLFATSAAVENGNEEDAEGGKQLLEEAVVNFKNALQPNDRKAFERLSNPTAEDVTSLVRDVDERLGQKQKRRRTLQNSTFATFVQSMQQFAGIVDTCVQSNPEIAALVWGGMKFVLLAFSNYLKYLEEITDMCEQMGRLCPQYERFGKLFPTHIELQDSICEFYSIVVDFFREALLFLYSSAFKQFAIATFRPFSDKFSNTIRLLGFVSKTVEQEITYSSQQEEHVERVNNAAARTEARDFYNLARITYHGIQEDRIKLSDEARRSKRERILRNICNYPYYFDFTNNLYKRQEASGQWIFDTPDYKAWLDFPKSSGLWYHAIPGFGKSVLTAGVVESLLDTSKLARIRHNISYFFCAYTNSASLSARTIISSILHQLFYYSNDLPQDLLDNLEAQFNDKASSSRVLLPDTQRFLTKILKENKARNFIVIDGLDECNDKERGVVLRILKQVFADNPDNLKILISSRGSQDIARALKEFRQLDLANSNQQDIEIFIAQALRDKELEGQLPELPLVLFDKIKTFLAENAKGLFLWVDLQITEICKEARIEDIEAALPGLPRDLNELYSRVLERIRQQRRPEVARSIFKWISYAVRPLTLDELKEAIAIEDSQISAWASLKRQTEMDDSKWLQNCENLVVLNKGNGTVQLAHSTIKEFLEASISQNSGFQLHEQDHQQLAEFCIRYFQLPEFTDQQQTYQRVVIQSQGFSTKNLLAGTTAEAEETWTGWFARKAYEYTALSPRRFSAVPASALIKKEPTTLLLTPGQSFKKLLRAYPFLDYASGNWLKHLDSSRLEIPPSQPSRDTGYVFNLMMKKYHRIRFPWQNYFTPDLTTFCDDLFNLFDWAIRERVELVFDIAYIHISKSGKSQLAKGHATLFLDYWLEVDTFREKHERTRFQRFCLDLDPKGGMAWKLLHRLKLDLNCAGPQISKRLLYKDPSILCDLLCVACDRADVKTFDGLMGLVEEMPGAFYITPHSGLRMQGQRRAYKITKHLGLETYEQMVRNSIGSSCWNIFKTLHQDSYVDFIRALSIESRSSLLHLAVDLERANFFELLMEHHWSAMHHDSGDSSTLTQKAVELGNEDLFKICVRKDYQMTSRSKSNRLYPVQIAAKLDNLAIMKLMKPFLRNANVDATASGSSDTALTYAIKNHNVEMVQLLIDAGADILKESNKQKLSVQLQAPLFRPEEWNFPLWQFLNDPDPDIVDLLLQDPRFIPRLTRFYSEPDLYENPVNRLVDRMDHELGTCRQSGNLPLKFQTLKKIRDAMTTKVTSLEASDHEVTRTTSNISMIRDIKQFLKGTDMSRNPFHKLQCAIYNLDSTTQI
ncbi:hypothetical protein Dda_1959 [Drechslerella dactyloides]|uniref:Pre-rRNA-processing protein IPI1 n=1 Tax=Drechslerella dactyloides TaxID=74499 RepID=A0AAD6NL26_DREDA|nr:hypothetical protein Dda_1959 [Drechslerella dactyloides]